MRTPILRAVKCLCRISSQPTAALRPYPAATATAAIRPFSSTSSTASGHSRWSKIKHDKGKADARRGASYSKLSQEITYASREGGLDMSSNLRLKAAVEAAKKAGMPKDRITTALERGQGRSTSGAALETVLVEAIGPGNVALVVDCLTDNKLRTLQDVKYILGKHNGQVTPTSYLFARKGMVRVVAGSGGHEFDSVLESALEIEGTEDVEEVAEGEDGKPEILITTEPARTGPVATEIRQRLPGLKVINYGIEWVPNEDTMVGDLSEKNGQSLSELLEKLEEADDVSDVYTNAKA